MVVNPYVALHSQGDAAFEARAARRRGRLIDGMQSWAREMR
jgi:hypothetical protein